MRRKKKGKVAGWDGVTRCDQNCGSMVRRVKKRIKRKELTWADLHSGSWASEEVRESSCGSKEVQKCTSFLARS